MHCMCWIPPCAGNIDTYSHKKEHENLTGTNTWVIQFIADHKDGPVYLRDIERRFGITRSTASKVVDMLVRNGFVERHTGETDARLRRLTLTEKSENLLADIRADHEAMEAVLTKGFTQNEKETMLTYLRRSKNKCRCCLCRKAAKERKERCRWLKKLMESIQRTEKRIPYWPWSPSAVRSPSRSSSRF